MESPWTPDYPHTLSKPFRGYNDWSGRTERYECESECDILNNDNDSPYKHQDGSHYLELRRRRQREREKEKAKDRDRERGREREREREREKDRDRDREKEKEKEKRRERERELDRLEQTSFVNHPYKASALASGTSYHTYPRSSSPSSKYHTQPLSPYNPTHNTSPLISFSADRYRIKNLDLDLDLDLDSSISDR